MMRSVQFRRCNLVFDLRGSLRTRLTGLADARSRQDWAIEL